MIEARKDFTRKQETTSWKTSSLNSNIAGKLEEASRRDLGPLKGTFVSLFYQLLAWKKYPTTFGSSLL